MIFFCSYTFFMSVCVRCFPLLDFWGTWRLLLLCSGSDSASRQPHHLQQATAHKLLVCCSASLIPQRSDRKQQTSGRDFHSESFGGFNVQSLWGLAKRLAYMANSSRMMELPGVHSQNKSDDQLLMWRGLQVTSGLLLISAACCFWPLTSGCSHASTLWAPSSQIRHNDLKQVNFFFDLTGSRYDAVWLGWMAAASVARVQSWRQPCRWSCRESPCCPPLRAGQWRQHFLRKTHEWSWIFFFPSDFSHPNC